MMLARNPQQQRRLEAKYAFSGQQAHLERTSWRASPVGSGAEESDGNNDNTRIGGDGERSVTIEGSESPTKEVSAMVYCTFVTTRTSAPATRGDLLCCRVDISRPGYRERSYLSSESQRPQTSGSASEIKLKSISSQMCSTVRWYWPPQCERRRRRARVKKALPMNMTSDFARDVTAFKQLSQIT